MNEFKKARNYFAQASMTEDDVRRGELIATGLMILSDGIDHIDAAVSDLVDRVDDIERRG